MFPIIGGRKVEHLQDNLEALTISLSKEQIDYLDSLKPFDKGYPLNVLVRSKLPRCYLVPLLIIYYLPGRSKWISSSSKIDYNY